MVRFAVNKAREHQLKSVAALRLHMKREWPKKPKSIEKALTYWANNAAKREHFNK
jgi:hypothetical protein